MNLLFALVLTVGVLTIFGDYAPVVHEVQEGMPAEQQGIQAGDRIVRIAGQKIDFYMEFASAFSGFEDDVIPIEVERDGERIMFEVPLVEDVDTGSRIIGLTYSNERVTFDFFEAIALSFKWLYLIIAEMLSFLGGLIFRGQGAGDVAGPVGTISLIGQAVRSGPEVILRMASLLSINLGIMNLLPFPALDGGRLVFLGIEAVRGKPLARNKEGMINFVGLIVLFVLMILLTYQDIVRLVS